jgi:hypothetical protein
MIYLLASKYFPEKSTNAIVATTDATRLGDNIQRLETPHACSFQPQQRASDGGKTNATSFGLATVRLSGAASTGRKLPVHATGPVA